MSMSNYWDNGAGTTGYGPYSNIPLSPYNYDNYYERMRKAQDVIYKQMTIANTAPPTFEDPKPTKPKLNLLLLLCKSNRTKN